MSEQPSSPLQNGDIVLDRYRVERGIAQGGHSLVYEGLDERLSRPVCIKAFHKLAGEKGIWDTAYEHFVQEAFALSKLAHPNTLRIYDFGHLDGGATSPDLDNENRVPIQVSEFMAGGTLASVVHNHGPLPVVQGLRIIGKLAQALAEAHRLGIVHRDIKPQNILFTSTGKNREPKLADFGIAKSVTSGNFEYQAQETQVVVGFPLAMYSPSWAAPEQLDGAPASPAADIFSLSLLAVYALSGKAICKGDSPDEAHDRREKAAELAGLALKTLDIRPNVIRLIQDSCAYRQADRPVDAEEFASALQSAMNAPQVPSRRPLPFQAPTQVGLPAAAPNPRPEASIQTPAPIEPLRIDPAAKQIALSQQPQTVDGQTYQFVEMHESTTLHWGDTRAQFTVTPTPGTTHNITVAVKGLTTFVSKASGRPTRAVHLTEDGFVDLLSPSKEIVGRICVSLGTAVGDRHNFQVGSSQISISTAECPCPILVDCPALKYSYILFGLSSGGLSIARQRQI